MKILQSKCEEEWLCLYIAYYRSPLADCRVCVRMQECTVCYLDVFTVSKAQLQKLQDEMENLRDQKDSTILSMRQDAHVAQEEMQVFRRSMEKAAAEREHEISALKSNLATLTGELEKWQVSANKYEREIDSLQANHQQQNQQRDKVAKQQGTSLTHIIHTRFNIYYLFSFNYHY